MATGPVIGQRTCIQRDDQKTGEVLIHLKEGLQKLQRAQLEKAISQLVGFVTVSGINRMKDNVVFIIIKHSNSYTTVKNVIADITCLNCF